MYKESKRRLANDLSTTYLIRCAHLLIENYQDNGSLHENIINKVEKINGIHGAYELDEGWSFDSKEYCVFAESELGLNEQNLDRIISEIKSIREIGNVVEFRPVLDYDEEFYENNEKSLFARIRSILSQS